MQDPLAEVHDLSALSALAPQLASTFASIGGDIALVIDGDGVVRSVAVGASALLPSPDAWVGKPWTDTVTGDTRPKIEQLLRDASQAGVARRREVNHPGGSGATGPHIPVAYAAVRLGEKGPVLAVGRDLRAIATIQQRFADSQHEMERGYWKLRQTELRYRMLFQVATDAVLVVDALTLKVVEANQAAGQLFARPAGQLVGQAATSGLDVRSHSAVEAFLVAARSTGGPAELRARLGGSAAMVDLSATPFRGDEAMLLLVRARAVEPPPGATAGHSQLAYFVERMPDAVVITDSSGRVLMANPAFLELCEVAGESQIKSCPLGEWVGGSRHDLPMLLGQAKRQGIVTQANATLRRSRGQVIEVSLSATMLAEGDQECVGFTVRRLAQRSVSGVEAVDELAAAIDRLSARIGRASLPDLLREAGDLAEHHLLMSAIERAEGDRNVAAGLLGITRDNLGQRLRRVAHLAGARGGNSPHAPLLN